MLGVALLAVALLALTLCRDDRSNPAITIGAFNFPESAILSNIYGGALRDSGFAVKFRTNLGSREIVGPALQDGSIDVYLGYAATDLEFWNDNAGQATSDVVETLSRLNDVLQPRSLLALDPAQAVNQNTFAVMQATADRLRITKLSDLTPLASQLTLGGPPECPTRPFCAKGLETRYGIRFKSFTALDAGGPLTKAALRNGDIDVALLFTSDATGFVLLEDDRQLQNADAVVPVVRPEKVDDRARSVMNDVSAKLTTESLSELNQRFTATGGRYRRRGEELAPRERLRQGVAACVARSAVVRAPSSASSSGGGRAGRGGRQLLGIPVLVLGVLLVMGVSSRATCRSG